MMTGVTDVNKTRNAKVLENAIHMDTAKALVVVLKALCSINAEIFVQSFRVTIMQLCIIKFLIPRHIIITIRFYMLRHIQI